MTRYQRLLFIWSLVLYWLLILPTYTHIYAQVNAPPVIKAVKEKWWEPGTPANAHPLVNSANINTPGESHGLEDWTRLVVQVFGEGNWDIYTVLGARPWPRLATSPANDLYPRLNSGGTRVAFASDRGGNFDIYTVGVDNTGLTQLTFNSKLDTLPVWSPDGKKIAFVSMRTGNADIFVMNADGSNVVQLTTNATDDVFPAWSPDGAQLVWVNINGADRALWVMNVDASNQRPLLSSLRFLQHPIWSPDGLQIAFDYDANNDGWNDLAMINADGTNQLILAYAENNQDLYVNSWYAFRPNKPKHLLISQMNYVFSNATLINTYSYIFLVDVCCRLIRESFINIGYEAFPDAQPVDLWPPSSKVQPLPEFSRARALYLHWLAEDVGPAGIQTVLTEYRQPPDNTWQEWLHGQIDESKTLGHKLYFRSIATDKAENVQPRPVDDVGDASTTPYYWDLSGRLTDNRKIPLADHEIRIDPAPLDANPTDNRGHYHDHMITTGAHTVNGQAEINIQGDTTRDFYIPPANSILITPHVTLGNACVGLCLNDTANSERQWNFSGTSLKFSLVIDAQGNSHILWTEPQTDRIYYQQRTVDGIWGLPEFIADEAGTARGVDLAIDKLGTIHAVWDTYSSPGEPVRYTQKSALGQWTQPEEIGSGSMPTLVIGDDGGVHVMYRCNDSLCKPGIFYRERLPTGSWEQPLQLDNSVQTLTNDFNQIRTSTTFEWRDQRPYALMSSHDGTLTLAWLAYTPSAGLTFDYQTRSPNRVWSKPQLGFVGYNLEYTKLIFDPTGRLHVLWLEFDARGNGILFHSYQTSNTSWSTPSALFNADSFSDNFMRFDAENRPHIIDSTWVEGTLGGRYVYGTGNDQWSEPSGIRDTKQTFQILAVQFDANQRIHAIIQDDFTPRYITEILADQDETSSFQQTIVISPTFQHPTLTFFYQITGVRQQALSLFDLQVSKILTTGQVIDTQVFSATGYTGRTLAWIDLTPWAGKTITLTFAVHQSTGEPILHAYVDEVTVGPWITPLALKIVPSHLEAGIQATLTISGENFLDTTSVQVGSQSLTTHVLNPHTLEVDLPADFTPGLYNLRITNPDGQFFVYPDAIAIGQQIYLPDILR